VIEGYRVPGEAILQLHENRADGTAFEEQ